MSRTNSAGLPPRVPAHARSCAIPRPVRPHAGEASDLRHRPDLPKIGGRVVYALEDLKAWADRGAKTSTSDPGAGPCLPAKRVTATAISPASCAADPFRASRMTTGATIRHQRQPNASNSNCFVRCLAISRHATRRISWPIRSSRSPSPSGSTPIDFRAGEIAIRVEAVPPNTAWRPSGTPTC